MENNNKWRDFIRNYANYATVAVICLVYTASAFITMGKTGQTVPEIIINTVLSFLVGVAINHAEKSQGINAGLADEHVTASVNRFEGKVEELMPEIEQLDDWCQAENRRNYKLQRAKILSNCGMAYSQCFDQDGVALPFTPDILPRSAISKRGLRGWMAHNANERRKERGYYKAVNLKLTELTAGELTSEGGDSNDPFRLGRSINKYMMDTGTQDMASKLIISIIFGYYTVEQAVNFSWATLIWRLTQVAIFLAMGSVKMDKSRIYVQGEYRGRIDNKYRHLCRFENEMKKGSDDHETGRLYGQTRETQKEEHETGMDGRVTPERTAADPAPGPRPEA